MTNTTTHTNHFIIQRSELEGRWEPHFYTKENKELVSRLRKKKHYNLKEIIKFSSESWDQKSYFKETFPYIEISEIDLDTGDVMNYSTVEIENAPSRAKMIVRQDDIIVSTTRPTRGAISFLNEIDDIKIASTGFAVLRQIDEDLFSKEALFKILRLPFSLQQMGQRSSGGNYPAITQEELGKIVIPHIDKPTQRKIVNLYQTAYNTKKHKEQEAQALLNSIDTYLLDELGITIPEKDNSLESRMFTVNFSEVSGWRFDPEYYSEYYLSIIESINNSKFTLDKLKSQCDFVPGYAFSSNDYLDTSSCVLITIKNISKNSINVTNTTFLPDNFYNKYSPFQIKRNDLLIAMTGATIGKVGIYESEKKALLNQRNGIIKSDNMNTYFLMNLLNTSIYQSLILRNSVGGAQPNISESAIMDIRIPIPPPQKQTEIASHIIELRNKAKKLQKEAQEILNQAKATIENMILT